LKLWEISLVTFPINEMATVTSLDYGREIREFRELLADCRKAMS
jgi:hypothetical protein